MAALNVTSTTDTLSVEFNDFFRPNHYEAPKRAFFRKNEIHSVLHYGTFITIKVNTDVWQIDITGEHGSLKVDYIDTINPIDMDHLYNLVKAFIE